MRVKIRSCQVIKLILTGFVLYRKYKALGLNAQTSLNTNPVSMRIIHGLVSTQLKDHLKYSVRNERLQLQRKADDFRFSFFAMHCHTLERLTFKCG